MSRFVIHGIFFLTFLLPTLAIEVSWQPNPASTQHAVEIILSDCPEGGTLHWGVNAQGNQWETPLPAYQPAGSTMDGLAVRTPLTGPDEKGSCRVTLGPFKNPNQVVQTIDFAIQWNSGGWENLGGKDFHIRIAEPRIILSPPHPTANDVITVTVLKSAPGGFLHWGVNANAGAWSPPHFSYWPPESTAFPDEQSIETPLPKPNSKGESILQLGPFNSGAQVVTSLHMVVHWGEEWDVNGGKNYNTFFSEDDLPGLPSVVFLEPTNELTTGDAWVASIRASADTTTELWLDGELLAFSTNRNLETSLSTTNLTWGQHALVARADKEGLIALKQHTLWHLPEIITQERPEDVPLGSTEHPDGSTTFALYAPGKKLVSLVGDFNQWNPITHMMALSSDGSWWCRLDLEPGTYAYQYEIDGGTRLADPFAHDVAWTNLLGKETHEPKLAKAVIEVGQPPFPWTDQAYQRPKPENLLIYEFYIEDLCPGEGFTGVIQRLDYIKALGANAIEPLPFTEFSGSESWGYNPSFHLAPESTFGTPRELKALINAAHQRGMAVIFDTVLNHMDYASPLHQLYGADYQASPYFRKFDGENWGFPDLDQTSPAFKHYVERMLHHWIQEYHIDGFRYDATRWVEWEGYNDWGASWFAYAAKQADSNNLQIAEHLPIDHDLLNTTEMDASWHAHFRWRLREMLEESRLNTEEAERIFQPLKGGFTNTFQRVVYVESHDEERLVLELLKKGYSFDEALQRSVTATALTLTAPGIAMIYSGQEFGEYSHRNVGPNPLHWDVLELPVFQAMLKQVQTLARLRTTHPALASSDIDILVNDATWGVLAFRRGQGPDQVVAAANFSDAPRQVALPLTGSGGEWKTIYPSGGTTYQDDITWRGILEPGASIVMATTNHPGD